MLPGAQLSCGHVVSTKPGMPGMLELPKQLQTLQLLVASDPLELAPQPAVVPVASLWHGQRKRKS